MISQTFPKQGKKNELSIKEKSMKIVWTNNLRAGLSKTMHLILYQLSLFNFIFAISFLKIRLFRLTDFSIVCVLWINKIQDIYKDIFLKFVLSITVKITENLSLAWPESCQFLVNLRFHTALYSLLNIVPVAKT